MIRMNGVLLNGQSKTKDNTSIRTVTVQKHGNNYQNQLHTINMPMHDPVNDISNLYA